ncbi:MAG: hypothetical protein IKI58_01860 [Oscillospiraceae bacterium]|nr:hypothetical protein [Oscillospiraceae bacterium]
MHSKKKSFADAVKQPLPEAEIQRNARHGKTASHLSEAGDLPIDILEKEIPKTDLHDM